MPHFIRIKRKFCGTWHSPSHPIMIHLIGVITHLYFIFHSSCKSSRFVSPALCPFNLDAFPPRKCENEVEAFKLCLAILLSFSEMHDSILIQKEPNFPHFYRTLSSLFINFSQFAASTNMPRFGLCEEVRAKFQDDLTSLNFKWLYYLIKPRFSSVEWCNVKDDLQS